MEIGGESGKAGAQWQVAFQLYKTSRRVKCVSKLFKLTRFWNVGS